jgi:hypothetical protein
MENRDTSVLTFGAIVSLFGVFVSLMYFNDKPTPVVTTNICKEDSLQRVIIDLQIELKSEQDGWDSKEKRYEQILFEYEYGLDHLKNYHLESYKDFHRILSHKEYYSHEDERENKKRLETPKW